MQRTLDRGKLLRDMVNSARFLKSHELSTGKLGATGFCWGGGAVNHLAVTMGEDLRAAVPFYGAAAASEDVPAIRAALLVHYPGTRHGFHNNSTPRYSEEAAWLAWERTIEFFDEHLS